MSHQTSKEDFKNSITVPDRCNNDISANLDFIFPFRTTASTTTKKYNRASIIFFRKQGKRVENTQSSRVEWLENLAARDPFNFRVLGRRATIS